MKIHRTPRAAITAIAIGAMCFTACSANESSSPVSDATTTVTDASTPGLDEQPSTSESTAPTASTTPTVTTTPAQPEPQPPASTSPPPTNAPTPTPDPPPTDAPTGTEPPLPEFDSFEASNVSACAAPDVSVPTIERTVTLSWDIVGADSIYVAVGNVDGVYEGDLPATGSIQLFVPCPDAQTYYVVAENASGRTVMEATR